MPSYLAEAYVGDAAGAVDDARAQALRTAALGGDVVYVRTTYIPDDEMVVHVFEAPSIETLTTAGALAELVYDRMVRCTTGA
jgi:hypothetical protein